MLKPIDKLPEILFFNVIYSKQDFRKFINRFEHSPYLGYRSKQLHNEPTEAYFFIIKYITKKIKSEKHVQLRTRGVKLSVKGKIGHLDKTIGHVNKAIQ